MTHFRSEVILSQGDESSALSIRNVLACVWQETIETTRNNRSFPVPLNASVWLYQLCAHSISFNQKRGKGEVRKTEPLLIAVANKSYL